MNKAAFCLIGYRFYFFPNIAPPRTIAPIKRIIKMKNKTFATDAAPLAISVNPKIAATIAIIKKVAAHFNIVVSFRLFTILFDMKILCQIIFSLF